MGSKATFPLLALAVAAAAPGSAAAHAFPRPYDLPLPLGHWLLGAGLAVVLSFLAALGTMRLRARPARVSLALPPRATRAAVALVQALSVALFVLLLAAGLFGNQGDWDRNILPVAVWVIWWVGMAFVCAVAGDLWALVNPWAIIGRGVARLTRKSTGAPLLRLPDRVGVWPGVALFLLFAWVELVWPSNAVPQRLACAILLYSALTFACMAVFGAGDWLRRGEVFALFFGLFGRFAPLSAETDPAGRPRLVLRAPGAGLTGAGPPTASMTAFVLCVLATVSFDGLSETALWAGIAGPAVDMLYRAGVVAQLGFVNTQTLVKTAGLLAAPVIFAALYLGACWLTSRLQPAPFARVAHGFVLSLVPIAIGYHLAHYFSYLIIQGQMIVPLASDPFGRGWDLLGATGRPLDIDAVDMRLVWIVAVGGVVLGHMAAVVLAHRAALQAGIGARAQLPIVALMVAYTVISLWILAQPIVAH